jgi:SpoVK/Ycf46/Vps4 family AAA+-type ATPase
MIDPGVIAALEDAISRDPDNAGVRVHLASLLVMSGQPERALAHALVHVPDSSEALAVARDAARAAGDAERAERYGRLLGALDPALGGPPAGESELEPGEDQDPRRQRLHAEGIEDPAAGLAEELAEEEAEHRRVTLADVGGLEAVKAKLEVAFLAPLRDPEVRRYYGKSLRGGLLLYGPPGCGKTFLARAVAGELGAHFFPVGLNDVLDMWLGESERRLHAIFEEARLNAPCVVFLDEIDALGRRRSQLRQSAGRNVVNQLLAELDGTVSENEGVFVLAATNHPWDVDTALRRPGRLDRTLLVLPPDAPARATILSGALSGRPVEGVDVEKLARQTEGCSGADLVHLVEVAAEHALEGYLASGQMRPIGPKDVEAARREVAPSTRSWFSVAHGYAVYANAGGEYDDLLDYIRRHRLL